MALSKGSFGLYGAEQRESFTMAATYTLCNDDHEARQPVGGWLWMISYLSVPSKSSASFYLLCVVSTKEATKSC